MMGAIGLNSVGCDQEILIIKYTIPSMKRLLQIKGGLDERHKFNIDDQISSCKYSLDGIFLAAANDSGLIIIFDVDEFGKLHYSFEFKAHRGGHDWTNKKELKPSVISLDWMHRNGSYMGLVSAGVKSIKFWRVLQTSSKNMGGGSSLVPSITSNNTPSYFSSELKELPTLHSGYIRSFNLSTNEEYLLSTDGKTVLKWSVEKSNNPHLLAEAPHIPETTMQCQKIGTADTMDIETRDQNTIERQAEELEEWNDLSYITNCKFYGNTDNRFAYSTKMGAINYVDMRCSNSIRPSIVMEIPTHRQFLRRYLNVISDFQFRSNGFEIVARDYLHAKIWDIRNPSQPIEKHSIMPAINHYISELFDDMHHLDQFPMTLSPNGNKLVTGYLDSSFHELDLTNKTNVRYRVSQNNQCTPQRVVSNQQLLNFSADPKVNCVASNPASEQLCVTIRDSLFVFTPDETIEKF